jgi:hypothetical protein
MERIRLVKDCVDIHVILPIQVEGNYITLGWFLSQARQGYQHQSIKQGLLHSGIECISLPDKRDRPTRFR